VFQAVSILIIIVGMVAIVATIFGAASGRGLTVGLILAGCIVGLQAVALVGSAITDPPPAKPDASDSASPSAAPSGSSSGSASAVLTTG
jgi:UPF0716 family protein affecting phage T7 exclusion